jgi:DNA-binding Lrp family transcriptional regulator
MAVTDDLTQRVLTFVIEHPGTKLVDAEKALNVSRIEVGRTLRALMDRGKIRRYDDTRQYFPN